MRKLYLVTVLAVLVQVIAASLCVAQGKSDGAKKPQEGRLEYGGIILRDGGIVMKDLHDSFDGDGWISGVFENSSTPEGMKTGEALLLVVRIAKSHTNGLERGQAV